MGERGGIGVASRGEGGHRLKGALELAFPWKEVRIFEGMEPHLSVEILVVEGEGGWGELIVQARGEGIPVVVYGSASGFFDQVEVVGRLEDLVEKVGYIIGQPGLLAYKEALVQMNDAAVISDANGKILFVNPAFTALTGYTLEDVRGRSPRFLAGGVWPPGLYKRMWSTVQRGNPWRGVVRGRTKEGRLYHQEMSLAPVKDGRGKITHLVAVLRDVTGEKALEERLFQVQRRESVACLVSGVAHEFCNMLTGILGYTQLLLLGRDRKDPDYEKLCLIETQTLRAAEVARNLLSLGQEEIPERRPLAVKDELLELRRLLEHLLPERIRVRWSIEEDLPPLVADPLHLRQIILNLVLNARDAMPRGGELEVGVHRERVRPGLLRGYVQGDPLPGEYVVFSVLDTGVGIPAQALSKIFEPFFTTKPKGKGTGLGLAAVQRMVRAHGGFISLESREGEGATFRVFLPLMEGVSGHEERGVLAERCSVMVVEDEDLVRKVLVDALKLQGCRVLDAANGEEALEKLEQEEVDLLITDLVMPKMGGEELVERVRERLPQVKVVVVSGYSSSERDPGVRSRMGEHLFLYKPFGVWEILKVVEECLASKEGGRDAHI